LPNCIFNFLCQKGQYRTHKLNWQILLNHNFIIWPTQ
jgi:hypothetical protein